MKLMVLLVAFIAGLALVSACDCDYHPGGCSISRPAPSGSKCHCNYKGWYTCGGNDISCGADENCPGGCSSYVCCAQGGGDCGGY